jgi:hypothetical protein
VRGAGASSTITHISNHKFSLTKKKMTTLHPSNKFWHVKTQIKVLTNDHNDKITKSKTTNQTLVNRTKTCFATLETENCFQICKWISTIVFTCLLICHTESPQTNIKI